MKIDFENLGSIDKGSVELNDLTLLCGKNNSGKTYAMYSLYGLLHRRLNRGFNITIRKSIATNLKKDGIYFLDIEELIVNNYKESVNKIEEYLKGNLSNLFGVTKNEFINTTVKLLDFDSKQALESFINKKINKEGDVLSILKNIGDKKIQIRLIDTEISEITLHTHLSVMMFYIMFPSLCRNSFLLPAERAGLNLFYKELFSIRNASLQRAQNDNIDSMDILKDILSARYAQPVKDYMQFLNEIGIKREESSIFSSHAQLIQSDVLGGNYDVDEHSNIFFTPIDSKNKLPLHFASSTVKTLFGLVFYLKHQAQEGDYLMIDEPELNLHPDNQRKIARVIVQLVNAGLKVIISTHSNYFVREINNLIMFKSNFSGVENLRKKYGYQENELLNHHQVSAYLFDDKKITTMEKDDEGIIVETFDTVTDELNQSSNEIYYAMQDAKELDD